MQENERVGRTHLHLNGFAQRLVLTRGQKTTRKWPIANKNNNNNSKNTVPTQLAIVSACGAVCWLDCDSRHYSVAAH